MLADGDDPTEIFFSRQGDPTDWDYTKNDSQAAVKLSVSVAGIMPQPVRCLVPNTDNCMIIGCDQSIWVLRGDPKTGGTAENLSDDVGIIDTKAWCKTPDASLVVMTQDGIYWMPPGCGSPFTSVSREVLPKELQGIDRNFYSVSMTYDQPSRMIMCFVSKESRASTPPDLPPGATPMRTDPDTWGSDPQSGGELITNHFAIDVRIERNGDVLHPRSASFWPMNFASSSEPFACHSRYTEGSQPYSVMGSRIGQILNFEWGSEVDDTVDYESYVVYGPFGMKEYTDVILKRIEVTLAKDSNPVTVEVFAADDPEDIEGFDFENPPFTCEINRYVRNIKHDVRLRGRCFYLIVRSIKKRLWAIDKINVTLAELGRSRMHRDAEEATTGPDPVP